MQRTIHFTYALNYPKSERGERIVIVSPLSPVRTHGLEANSFAVKTNGKKKSGQYQCHFDRTCLGKPVLCVSCLTCGLFYGCQRQLKLVGWAAVTYLSFVFNVRL